MIVFLYYLDDRYLDDCYLDDRYLDDRLIYAWFAPCLLPVFNLNDLPPIRWLNELRSPLLR